MSKKTLEEQLWSRTKKNPETGCIEWTGPVNSTGYGWITRNGKTRGAHVWAYESGHGAVPQGKFVCHHCDNPRCCNPDHHYAGDLSTNANDMYARNRHSRRNGWTKGSAADREHLRASVSAALTGKPKSEEMRAKVSKNNAMKRPEVVAKMLASRKLARSA